MSAADAFTRATISALSASVRLTGPLADLMYRVLPSTLSIVPATRWACCAEAVETANTVAKAAAVKIRIVLMSGLPKGLTRGPRIHPPARIAKGCAPGPLAAGGLEITRLLVCPHDREEERRGPTIPDASTGVDRKPRRSCKFRCQQPWAWSDGRSGSRAASTTTLAPVYLR